MSVDTLNHWWKADSKTIEFYLEKNVVSISQKTLSDYFHVEDSKEKAERAFSDHLEVIKRFAEKMQLVSQPRSQAPHYYLSLPFMKTIENQNEEVRESGEL